jgi:hypothetical protein
VFTNVEVFNAANVIVSAGGIFHSTWHTLHQRSHQHRCLQVNKCCHGNHLLFHHVGSYIVSKRVAVCTNIKELPFVIVSIGTPIDAIVASFNVVLIKVEDVSCPITLDWSTQGTHQQRSCDLIFLATTNLKRGNKHGCWIEGIDVDSCYDCSKGVIARLFAVTVLQKAQSLTVGWTMAQNLAAACSCLGLWAQVVLHDNAHSHK